MLHGRAGGAGRQDQCQQCGSQKAGADHGQIVTMDRTAAVVRRSAPNDIARGFAVRVLMAVPDHEGVADHMKRAKRH
ncbi:hypothetical protein BN126310139 [Stenotrophomonas maltophilia]|nr:hypothetical protein BN126310139 [Stenotrophomonas maltophilia]